MRLACKVLLGIVAGAAVAGAAAAGVAPAETLSSAVPADKKNPIDAVEATYGRVKRRWRNYMKPKPKPADAPAEKSAKPKDEPAPEKPKKPSKPWFQKPRQIFRGLLRALCATIVVLATPEEKTALDGAPRSPLQKPATPFTASEAKLAATPEDRALDGAGLISALGSRTAMSPSFTPVLAARNPRLEEARPSGNKRQ